MSYDLVPSSAWQDPPPPAAPRKRRWTFVLGVIAASAAILYGVGAAWASDRVPRGVTVAGVDVGGMSSGGARAALTAAFSDVDRRTVALESPVGSVEVPATDLGLSVDLDATVDQLTGLTLLPGELWKHIAGAGPVPAVVSVERDVFAAAMEASREALDGEPTEGSLSVATGAVEYTPPVAGSVLDIAATEKVVRRWWPEQRTIDVVGKTSAPQVSAAEFERVRDEFADVAVSGPLTITAGEITFPLAPDEFGPAVTFEASDDGTLTPTPDLDKLSDAVHAAARTAGVEREAKDAVVTFSGRTPKVAPSVDGMELDAESIPTDIWTAIGTPERAVTVKTKAVPAKFTTERAKATLPKEKISSFTTYYACCQSRVHNIKKGAAVVNGTYVLPGEQFSLNDVLGDTTTAASGYVPAGIIRYGRAAESFGGGLSQVSTTVFNAAFFSGMKLDAWTPHYYYISRYPEGREATISYPNLHHKWTNVTDGGVLVEATTTDTSITVTFYGQKKWDIEATKSARYNIVKPKVIRDDDPECIDQSPVNGFNVDVGRIFKQNGKVVDRETYTTKYWPKDDVTCTG